MKMAKRGGKGLVAPTEQSISFKKLGWQEQAEVKKAVKEIHQQVAEGKADISVHADSPTKVHAILHEAYPNAKRVPGAGPKPQAMTRQQVRAFQEAKKRQDGVYYHQDYQLDNQNGILYGHESLPPGHSHQTVKHINVEGWNTKPDGAKEYVDVTIYIDKK